MSGHRKLGRNTGARLGMLRNLTTDLIVKGKITTTEHRAREVRKIAEKLITIACKEQNNFQSREVLSSQAKLDGKGHKVLKSKISKNDKRYDVVDRELTTRTVQVDDPSRLAARRQTMQWLVKTADLNGRKVNPSNVLFDEVAPRYSDRSGGYTRMTKIGPRRGDGAMMVVLELV